MVDVQLEVGHVTYELAVTSVTRYAEFKLTEEKFFWKGLNRRVQQVTCT